MQCRVNKCCFCCPLRWGIILFAYVNVTFSILAMVCMVVTTNLQRTTLIPEPSLELVTVAVLFGILGMSVILNILLLVAGYQKDVQLLKLYNHYAAATTLAALIPSFILLSRLMFAEVGATLFAIAMQLYVIVLVRSEILKIKQKRSRRSDEEPATSEVVVPDRATLL